VLFDERTVLGSDSEKILYGNTKYDADLTADAAGKAPLKTTLPPEWDATAVLKVMADRDCAEWLACQSFIKDENDRNICFDIGLCDSVDLNGECDNFIFKEKINQTYQGSGDSVWTHNMAGYAKAGYFATDLASWPEPHNYYHFAAMEQTGDITLVPNGNFEIYGENEFPIGWYWEGNLWNEDSFKAVTNPVDSQDECLRLNCKPRAPEGKSYLKIGSNYSAISEYIDVMSLTPYTLSSFINTLNLQEGEARVSVVMYNNQNQAVNEVLVLSSAKAYPWRHLFNDFQTTQTTSRVRIKLHGQGEIGNMTATVSGDNRYRMYINGTTDSSWTGIHYPAGVHTVPLRAGKNVIAVSVEDLGAACYGLAARFQIPGWPDIVTNADGRWKCTTGIPDSNDYWMDINFDDSAWPAAVLSPYDETVCTACPACLIPPLGSDYIWALGASFNRNVKCRYSFDYNGSVLGNYYFDDVKIKPALAAKKMEDITVRKEWLTPQTCRLWPEKDALACEYSEPSGIYQKGWYGYCLEHDRYPGDPDTCLLWWPIDKPEGEGIDEGAGYNDRYPLYYCAQFLGRDLEIVEYRGGGMTTRDGCEGSPGIYYCEGYDCSDSLSESGPDCPPGYSPFYDSGSCGRRPWESGNYNWENWYCNSIASHCGDYWWATDGDLQIFGGTDGESGTSYNYSESDYGLMVRDRNTCKRYPLSDFPQLFYCLNLIQTVTSIGQNKYWAARVYQGSTYIVPENMGLNFLSPYRPFGALVPPDPPVNPYEWDNDQERAETQPLSVKNFPDLDDYATEVHAGTPYSCYGGGCDKAGLCSISKRFCYNFNPGIPDVRGSGAINPVQDHFQNPFTCPLGESCLTGYPVRNNLDLARELIKRLFAQSYGTWQWTAATLDSFTDLSGNRFVYPSHYDGNYRDQNRIVPDWFPPDNICDYPPADGVVDARRNYSDDYCAIPPIARNVAVDLDDIAGSKAVHLTFNSRVDPQQLPLVMYGIDWGDGDETIVAGVTLRDRQAEVHSMYHMYSYWDLKERSAGGYGEIDCSTPGTCRVQPQVRIKDNWGWCNAGIVRRAGGTVLPAARNFCEQYVQLDGWITVREK
jgi:hypothetical protein